MTVEVPVDLEIRLKDQADARGVATDVYLREVLKRGLQADAEISPKLPLKSGYGMWAKYGIDISEEDIAENRADMFRNFGEDF